MTRLYQVLYCSRMMFAPGADEVAEIRSILTASRRNNGRDGLTGGLLFSDGCFAQVLEGSMSAVMATFERIQRDERHSTVTVLQARKVARRDFPAWSMGYAGAARGMPDLPPLAGALPGALPDLFSGHTDAGESILGLLRRAVRENDEALLPVS